MEDVVSLERIDWVPILIHIFVLFHALTDALAKIGPFLLVLLVPLLQGLVVLLHHILLFTDNSEVFSKLLALRFLFVDVLIQLVDPLLQIVNFCVQ